jgi:hypothetical protein
MKIKNAILFSLSLLLSACTENQKARNFGGTMSIEVEGKLENITWRGNDSLWVLVRPRRVGEIAETHTFKENSNFGVIQGTVIIKEK